MPVVNFAGGTDPLPTRLVATTDSLPSRIMLVRAESARLAHSLGTLLPTAWHHPSACAGWEVGDAEGDAVPEG